jgi:hypothetical protein
MKRYLIVLLLFMVVCTSCLPLIQPDTMSDSSGDLDIYKDVNIDGDFYLVDTVWDDVSIAMAQARTPASLAPTWTPYQGTQVPAYSATQVNVLYFSAQLPHSYKEGTDIQFHIHLVYPDAVAGDSVWYFTYSWANMDDAFAAPLNSGQVVIASPGVANYHQNAEIIANIDGTGKKMSSILLCSIQRTGTLGTDTYGNVIYLISGDFHVQKDTIGSDTEDVK